MKADARPAPRGMHEPIHVINPGSSSIKLSMLEARADRSLSPAGKERRGNRDSIAALCNGPARGETSPSGQPSAIITRARVGRVFQIWRTPT
jgi:acetate kinase